MPSSKSQPLAIVSDKKRKYFGLSESQVLVKEHLVRSSEPKLNDKQRKEESLRKRRKHYHDNKEQINLNRRNNYHEKKKDPLFVEKERQYRKKTKDASNKLRRERPRIQKDRINEDQRKRNRIRKIQQEKNNKYYSTNKADILIQQKKYRDKKIMDEFHQLVDHSSRLLNCLKTEAKKIVPRMSNRSFRLFLGYVACGSRFSDLSPKVDDRLAACNGDNNVEFRRESTAVDCNAGVIGDRDEKKNNCGSDDPEVFRFISKDVSQSENRGIDATIPQTHVDQLEGTQEQTFDHTSASDESEHGSNAGIVDLTSNIDESDEGSTTSSTSTVHGYSVAGTKYYWTCLLDVVASTKTEFYSTFEERLKRRWYFFKTITPSCVFSFSDPNLKLYFRPNTIRPYEGVDTLVVDKSICWTPLSTEPQVHNNKRQLFLSSRDFDSLQPPTWVTDRIIDFMLAYLLRGTSPNDRIFGFIPCATYTWAIFYSKTIAGERSTGSIEDLQKEILFWVVNLNGNHWVLVVLVGVMNVENVHNGPPSCMLYFDPMNKERDIICKEERSVYKIVLLWLNYRLGDGDQVYTPLTFPMTSNLCYDRPYQRKGDLYNCGIYVFHYAFTFALWYDEWRLLSKIPRHWEFWDEFCEQAQFADSTDYDLPIRLRQQFSAVIYTLYATDGGVMVPSAVLGDKGTVENRNAVDEFSTHQANQIALEPFVMKLRRQRPTRSEPHIRTPQLNSFLLRKYSSKGSLMGRFHHFLTSEMSPISKYFHPIIPSTNSCRMNYQSRQAIRVFYGRDLVHGLISENRVERYVYGPLAVLQSTGFHPSKDYKVFPFTDDLSEIAGQLSALLNKKKNQVDKFNFLEVKMYLGDDLFKTMSGGIICDSEKEPLRLGCNKVVNAHNDLRFSDEGVQSEKDTARSDHPTVTVTVGSPRTIVFEHYVKNTEKESVDTKWTYIGKEHDQSIILENGSIFVLSPEDDKPTRLKRTSALLHKTKHRVVYDNNGISFAFVFRSVKKTSSFNPITNNWLWDKESTVTQTSVKKYLTKFESKNYIVATKVKRTEMSVIDENVRRYLERIKPKKGNEK